MEAAQQLMDQDLLGSRRFAVVRDDFEQHQVLLPAGGALMWATSAIYLSQDTRKDYVRLNHRNHRNIYRHV